MVLHCCMKTVIAGWESVVYDYLWCLGSIGLDGVVSFPKIMAEWAV